MEPDSKGINLLTRSLRFKFHNDLLNDTMECRAQMDSFTNTFSVAHDTKLESEVKTHKEVVTRYHIGSFQKSKGINVLTNVMRDKLKMKGS